MKRRGTRKVRTDSTSKLPLTCAWCAKRVGQDEERFGLGAKVVAGIDLSESEGTIVPLPLDGVRKVIPMIIAAKDSPAKQAGHDLCFMVCSRECGVALRRALVEEIGGIDGISSM